MQTIALPATHARLLTLQDLKQWAFPHWILWVAVLVLFSGNSLYLMADPRISMAQNWYSSNVMLTITALAMLALRKFKPEMFDWFLHRMWCTLMCVLMAAVLMRNLQVFNHLTMITAMPMQDDLLMSWDRSLGFDWLAYSKAITTSPLITKLLFIAYNDITFGGLAAMAVALIWLNLRVRTIEIIYMVVATGAICISAAAFFPARATMALLGDAELLSRLDVGTGVFHVEQMLQLRGNMPVFMEPDAMQGLVSFPSFHTCLALIIMWCARGNILTQTVATIIAVAIIIATPIFGGHYLVDVIGGASVTLLAICYWNLKIKHRVENKIPGTDANAFAVPRWLGRAKSK